MRTIQFFAAVFVFGLLVEVSPTLAAYMGLDINVFTFPMVKLVAMAVWLVLVGLTMYKLWCTVTDHGIWMDWATLGVLLMFIGMVYGASQRHTPTVRLDTGGVQAEQATRSPAVVDPEISHWEP
jgi:hypothetical protein